jgi:hypothetical protein
VKGKVLGRRRLADIAALVVRMATENPTWGSTRIRDGLKLPPFGACCEAVA